MFRPPLAKNVNITVPSIFSRMKRVVHDEKEITHKVILETLTENMLSEEEITKINRSSGKKGGQKGGQKGGDTYEDLITEHRELNRNMASNIALLKEETIHEDDDDDEVTVEKFFKNYILRKLDNSFDGKIFVREILETLYENETKNQELKEIPIQEILCEKLKNYKTGSGLILKINEEKYVIPYDKECKDIIYKITNSANINFTGAVDLTKAKPQIAAVVKNKMMYLAMVADNVKHPGRHKLQTVDDITMGGDSSKSLLAELEKSPAITSMIDGEIETLRENYPSSETNASLKSAADILYKTIKDCHDFNTKFISYSKTTEHDLNLTNILDLLRETNTLIMTQQNKIAQNKQETVVNHTKKVDLVRHTMTFMILIVLAYLFVGAFSTSSPVIGVVQGLISGVTPDSVKFITMLGIVVSFLTIASQSKVVLEPLAESVVFSTDVGTKLITSAPKAVSNAPTTVRTAIDSATEKLSNAYNYFFANKIIKPISEITANTENVSSATVSAINKNTNYTEIIPENLTLPQSEKNVMEIIAKLQKKIPRELSKQAEEKLGEYKAAIEAAEKTIIGLQSKPISDDPKIQQNNIKKLKQIANMLSSLNNNTKKTGGGAFIGVAAGKAAAKSVADSFTPAWAQEQAYQPPSVPGVKEDSKTEKKSWFGKSSSTNDADVEQQDNGNSRISVISPDYIVLVVHILTKIREKDTSIDANKEYDDLKKLAEILDNVEKDKQQGKFSLKYLYNLMENIITTVEQTEKQLILPRGGNKVRRYNKTIKKHNYKKKLSKKRSRK
uniref:Uncharacterized protein n=1 Tax=viral metagenome TaxID=1070528 RepID=A0A6C0D6Z4_9ZZZZ